MQKLKQHLSSLVAIEGINAAVVVSRDGFVVDGIVSNGALDTEAVGAVVSAGIGSAEVMGNELGAGDLTQTLFEYKGGVIAVSFLGNAAILAIVADLKANLGNIRYQVKKHTPEIEKSL